MWLSMSAIAAQGNDEVFEFLEAVLDEVIEIFPFGYIHIGGDEVRARQRPQPHCLARAASQLPAEAAARVFCP